MAPVTPRKQQATAAGSVTLASRSRRALVHSLVTPERSKVDKASTPVGTRKRKNTEINNLVHLGAAAADGRGNCQSLQEEGEPDSKQHERGLLAAPLELAAVAATKKRKVAPPINNTTPNRTSTPTGTATTAPVASTSRTSRLSLNAIKSIKPVSANAASYSASRRSIVPAPTPTTGTTVSTTTSTARTSRQHRDEQTRTAQELEAQEWKKKYRKAFKSFIFYFDALEDSKRREADACVKELGARSEPFFSKQVTHIVTSRALTNASTAATSSSSQSTSTQSQSFKAAPTTSNRSTTASTHGVDAEKENFLPPYAPQRGDSESPVKQNDSAVGPSRRPKARLGLAGAANHAPLKTPPKLEGRYKPYVDLEKAESQDILHKARAFDMKIWSIEKLHKMLHRLLDPHSPAKAYLSREPTTIGQASTHAALALSINGAKPSITSLLRAEALTGSTYERDLSADRPDYHYFNQYKNGFILVEDTSQEYQPCHAKEYDQRIYLKTGEDSERDTEWPTLWGGQEGRGAFWKPSDRYQPTLPLLENMQEKHRREEARRTLESPSIVAPHLAEEGGQLRRTVSMTALQKRQDMQGASNSAYNPRLDSYQIASGNSQILTSNIASGTSTATSRSGQVIGNGAGKALLANGIIVNKHLARLGGNKNATTRIVTVGGNVNMKPSTSTSNSGGSSSSLKVGSTLMAASKSNSILRKSLSVDSGMAQLRPPKEEPKKPGYCENCRVRYEDFKPHTRSRKHRKFATNPDNWLELDLLIANKIRRPILPELLDLYDAAGCEVPSDVEATDDEEDGSSGSGSECGSGDEYDLDAVEETKCIEGDSGYASKSSDEEEIMARAAEAASLAGIAAGQATAAVLRQALKAKRKKMAILEDMMRVTKDALALCTDTDPAPGTEEEEEAMEDEDDEEEESESEDEDENEEECAEA